MNPKIFADLRNILAKLYPDEVSIRRIVADADLDIQRITFNSNAVNNWHSVLTEAEKVHHIEILLAVVEGEYRKNPEFKSVYMTYRQSTDKNDDKKTGNVDTHSQAPAMPQRQRLRAVIAGLLLVGIAGGGLYWGIPGLRNFGAVLLTATTTVSDTGETEAQLAGASSTASAAPSPSSNTATVTQTQVSAMSFTSIPEPPTSTPTATFTVTPALTETPTPKPTVTATLIPAPTYPCEATVFSASGGDIINRIRAIPSSSGELSNGIQKGTEVEVRDKKVVGAEIWYHIFDKEDQVLGWILSTDLRLSDSCPN